MNQRSPFFPAAKIILAIAGACLLAGGLQASTQGITGLGSQPLYFEANHGQVNAAAPFIARGKDYQFLISPAGAQIILTKTTSAQTFSTRMVQLQFVGANATAELAGQEALPGKINYLVGNQSAKWQTGVATFARVQAGELYPGINLVYYGNQQQLEYDLTVAPGAKPEAIAIQFDGADKISVNAQGELVLTLGDSEIRQPQPVLYQTVNGVRQSVSGGYRLVDAKTVAFTISAYDHNLPLVIDPILSYSTYFGGTADDTAWKVAVDANGFVYVAGQTLSSQFAAGVPLSTPGVFQTNNNGGSYRGDAFVAKFTNNGSNLVYFSYLGGSQDDFALSLAVDGAGNVFLTGFTDSPDFPTNNARFGKISGAAVKGLYYSDAFVTELGSSGSNLVYSTYLGGSFADTGTGIAVDAAGNAYVAGYTYSADFPTTNAFVYQTATATNVFNKLTGSYNAFLAKIGPGGSPLQYSTYFGGTVSDAAGGIAVDPSGAVYLTGLTASPNFPVTTNAVQIIFGGATNAVSTGADAFVTKFAPSTTNLTLVYSTFIGGTNDDVGYGIVADAAGNAYVTGSTASPNFPNTATNLANQLTNNVSGSTPVINAFLTKLNPVGTSLGYSAVIGGNGVDIAYGVAVDAAGKAFITGSTTSTNFPALNTGGSLTATNAGTTDAFVTGFNSAGTALSYSVYFGGAASDVANSIALDLSGNAYIVGQTSSANFPTNKALHGSLNGASDAFLAKIIPASPTLAIQPAQPNVVLTKSAYLPEYQLESSTNLAGGVWTLVSVPAPPVYTNGFQVITLPATNSGKFFRLHKF
jgi:cysteine synthase